MRYERTKLFHDQMESLIVHLGYEYAKEDVIFHFIKSTLTQDVYMVDVRYSCDTWGDVIILWNGAGIMYDHFEGNPSHFHYEPKKSLSDECAPMIEALEAYIDFTKDTALYSFPAARLNLYRLKEILLRDKI